MKKLIFVRHAKAEDPAPGISDFERSLIIKGKTIAKLMAGKLKESEKSPGTIITSPAFRALETAIIFAGELGVAPENIIMDSNIYYKMNFPNLLELLLHAGDDTDTISLFGHNPSFSVIPDSLCKGGCDSMPKCGVIGISFNVSSWSEIKHNTGRIEYYLKPEKVL